MAKKKDIVVQFEINNQDEWEEAMVKPGLLVIDVCQSWCGPCIAMQHSLKTLKLSLQDELLSMAIAKADLVECLEPFTVSCEPVWLFFGGGRLLSIIKGPNPILVLKNIDKFLKIEHEVAEGKGKRVLMKDPYDISLPVERRNNTEDLGGEGKGMKGDPRLSRKASSVKEVAKYIKGRHTPVALIVVEPNINTSDKIGGITDFIKKEGFEILKEDDRVLTEVDLSRLYGKDAVEDLIPIFKDKMCHLFALFNGKDTFMHCENLLGIGALEDLKEDEEKCLMALFCVEEKIGDMFFMDNEPEKCFNDAMYFFPDMEIPKMDDSSEESLMNLKGELEELPSIVDIDRQAKKVSIVSRGESEIITVSDAEAGDDNDDEGSDDWEEVALPELGSLNAIEENEDTED